MPKNSPIDRQARFASGGSVRPQGCDSSVYWTCPATHTVSLLCKARASLYRWKRRNRSDCCVACWLHSGDFRSGGGWPHSGDFRFNDGWLRGYDRAWHRGTLRLHEPCHGKSAARNTRGDNQEHPRMTLRERFSLKDRAKARTHPSRIGWSETATEAKHGCCGRADSLVRQYAYKSNYRSSIPKLARCSECSSLSSGVVCSTRLSGYRCWQIPMAWMSARMCRSTMPERWSWVWRLARYQYDRRADR
jgi:hypothetical protein